MSNTSSPTTTRRARRAAILRLIGRREIRSQADLQALLEASGREVNQATLSRDLRDLGVLKGPRGYRLPELPDPPGPDPADLSAALRQWLKSLVVAQNQVVLRTPPGGAPPLALAIDRGELPLVLGTIAGDDTVLVICKSPPDARSTARRLERLR